MLLHLGFFSNQELCDWFGTTSSNISKKKKYWLGKLTEYCEFEPIRGGINIKKIFKETYIKNKNYQIVKDNFEEEWDNSGLDSCSRVSKAIYEKHQEELTSTESTVYSHARQVRNELYGKPMSKLGGSQGYCEFVWCKRDASSNRMTVLSPEEESLKSALLKKYFSTTDEKTVMVQNMIENNELSLEEAWDYYSEIINLPHSYALFLDEFQALTGIRLVRGTRLYQSETFTFE